MRITVVAPLHPTEDPDRVTAACKAVASGDVSHAADSIRLDGTDPEPLRQRIHATRIIDTFRGQALEHCRGASLEVHLDKQAAVAGKISFPAGAPVLGSLRVEFLVEPGDPWTDAESFLWWLCPETKDGQIV